MMRRIAGLALLFMSPFAGAAEPVPMVDGDCSEYRSLAGRHLQVESGIDLYIYQDEHYVWMCYTYPEGSQGQLDMTVRTNALPAPLNLHVSAQLGEWPVGREELIPKGPNSELWWKISGWTGSTLRFNGMDTRGDRQVTRLLSGQGRELQLSKKRFGRGEWQLALTIYQIKGQDGKMRQVQYPANGSFALMVQ